MKLSRPIKLLVAAGTAWIILYPLLFFALWLSMLGGFMSPATEASPFSIFSIFNILLPVHCLTLIVQLALMGFYLFHVIKNTLASDLVRVFSGIGVFFIPFLAMPAYYIIFILPDQPPVWALAKATKPSPDLEQTPSPAEASTSPGRSSLSRRNLAIILGGIGGVAVLVVAAVVLAYVLLINSVNQQIRQSLGATPTPSHYANVPLYSASEAPFYYPVSTESFKPISTFKGIYVWSYYNSTAILLADKSVFIAGFLHEPSNAWGSGPNLDLISAHLGTGTVNWQTTAGSAMLLADSKHIYAVLPEDLGSLQAMMEPAGIAAYDIDSGQIAWKRRFDSDYARGIGRFTLSPDGLVVDTYSGTQEATYVVDPATGGIKETKRDSPPNQNGGATYYDGLVIERGRYGAPDQIIALDAGNGSVIWKHSGQQVASNVAVGGPVTYFLTEKNQLIALNTKTGATLGTLALAPGFPPDFDFVNTPLFVAAYEDMVAIYYGDSRQLSVLRFTQPSP